MALFVILIFQWSENIRDKTENATLFFPIGFNVILTVINVGFLINDIGRQGCNFTETYLHTYSDVKICATNSYLAIGV